MAIPDSYLQELRLRADIEQLISPYVKLRRGGRLLMGLCPFHNEKTPSFAVYPDTSSFYCFGCGAGGDAISFLMRTERLDYIEAVKALSQRVGMQLPEDNYDDGLSKRRLRILSANREAAKFFHQQLKEPNGKTGLDYWLGGRGLSPQIVRQFGLGYAPPGWSALLDHMRSLGYKPDELVEANLVSRSEKNGKVNYYDRFRGRVMVPIIDLRGNVVAFGGRVLGDDKPKYINTSDTLAYKKGRDIYALNFAKNTANGRLILVEGYMDVIALHQAGFTQAVACLGTALTREQAQLLARYANEVVLSYDADEAGQRAAQRALEVLGQTNLKLRVIQLTGGKDPDDVLRTYGAERYRQLLEGAANDIEFALLNARGELDLTTPAGKADYLREAVRVLARCTVIERDIYAARLAEELTVDKQAILTQVEQVRKRDARRNERNMHRDLIQRQDPKRNAVDPQRGIHPQAARAEEGLLGLLLQHPDFYAKLRDKISAEQFVTRFNRELAHKLFARLENGHGIEPELLSGALTPEELNEAMRMKITCENVDNPWANAEGWAAKLLAEQPQDKPNLTEDNAFLGAFSQLSTKH
ncbi:MAG: DNA primase [Oscillospiraceae bacterium]|nr:DNA primase [Oscillospiraceae bacterium]